MKSLGTLLHLRDRPLASLGPVALAVMVLAIFVVPNYIRASQMKSESLRLEQATGEHLLKRSQLVALERDVAALRTERSTRFRPVGELSQDRLVETIARPVDGQSVRNQGIRKGNPERLPKDAERPLDMVERTVTVDMDGSFEAVFAMLDAAESLDQLIVPVRVDIAVNKSGQSSSGVRATIELREYFRPTEAKK